MKYFITIMVHQNSGFTVRDVVAFTSNFDCELKQIAKKNNWVVATNDQISDAYHNGMDMSTCLWGWGLPDDERLPSKYWFSSTGIICDTYKSPGFYTAPNVNGKCGVFLYGIKPPKNSIDNCLTTTNQVCMLPWSYTFNQWSKNDKPTLAGVY